MAKPFNSINIAGRLTEDPKVFGSNTYSLRIAVDYAGRDSTNPDQRTGFFTLKYFAQDNPNSRFVTSQIADNKMKKGSYIACIGELSQETWLSKDDSKQYGVVIIADNITYMPMGSSETSSSASKGESGELVSANISSAPDEF